AFGTCIGLLLLGEVILWLAVVLGVVVVGVGRVLPGFAEELGAQCLGEEWFNIDVLVGEQRQEVFDFGVAGGHQVGAVIGEPQVQDLDGAGAFAGGQLTGRLGCLGG